LILALDALFESINAALLGGILERDYFYGEDYVIGAARKALNFCI
jgi:hypothetical protein